MIRSNEWVENEKAKNVRDKTTTTRTTQIRKRKKEWISPAHVHSLPRRVTYAFRSGYSLFSCSFSLVFLLMRSIFILIPFFFILPLSNGSANGLLCVRMRSVVLIDKADVSRQLSLLHRIGQIFATAYIFFRLFSYCTLFAPHKRAILVVTRHRSRVGTDMLTHF